MSLKLETSATDDQFLITALLNEPVTKGLPLIATGHIRIPQGHCTL